MKQLNVNDCILKLFKGEPFLFVDKIGHMHLICLYTLYDQYNDVFMSAFDENPYYIVKEPYLLIHKDLPIEKGFNNVPTNKTLKYPFYDEPGGRTYEGSMLYLTKRADISSLLFVYDVIIKPPADSKLKKPRRPKFNCDGSFKYDYIFEKDVNMECVMNYICKDPLAKGYTKKKCINCKYCEHTEEEEKTFQFHCSCLESATRIIYDPFNDSCGSFSL